MSILYCLLSSHGSAGETRWWGSGLSDKNYIGMYSGLPNLLSPHVIGEVGGKERVDEVSMSVLVLAKIRSDQLEWIRVISLAGVI